MPTLFSCVVVLSFYAAISTKTTKMAVRIRRATEKDVGHILRLVKELAVFENALEQVRALAIS